eukprot:TRINITY_DN74798_c0_g1_i1.p1 TRINITY_DN74798_c0_g1~~TRINITY_DN74798_c0_g1_i1.p1  ORF type:complete len:482 (+),score=88.63 TRINITY_DN74798_c0_g1_i1:151-1596(+)
MAGYLPEALPKPAARPKSWGGELPEDPIVATQGVPRNESENDVSGAKWAPSPLLVPLASAQRAPRGSKRIVGGDKKEEDDFLPHPESLRASPLPQPLVPKKGADIRDWLNKQPSKGIFEPTDFMPLIDVERPVNCEVVTIEDDGDGDEAPSPCRNENLLDVLQPRWDLLDKEVEPSRRQRRVSTPQRRWEDEDDVDDPVNDDGAGSSTTASSPEQRTPTRTTSIPVVSPRSKIDVVASFGSCASNSPFRLAAQANVGELIKADNFGSSTKGSSPQRRKVSFATCIPAVPPLPTVLALPSRSSRIASSPSRRVAEADVDDPVDIGSAGSSATASSPQRRASACTTSVPLSPAHRSLLLLPRGGSCTASSPSRRAAQSNVHTPTIGGFVETRVTASSPQRKRAVRVTSAPASPARRTIGVAASGDSCAASSPARRAAQGFMAELAAARAGTEVSVQPLVDSPNPRRRRVSMTRLGNVGSFAVK